MFGGVIALPGPTTPPLVAPASSAAVVSRNSRGAGRDGGTVPGLWPSARPIGNSLRWLDARAVVDFHGLGRELLQESRGIGRLLLPPERPDPAATQVELPLSSRDANKEQPPFLFQLLVVIVGSRVGKQSLLQRVHEDDREFETLGGVQCHQSHRAGFLVPPVDGRGQRDFGKEVMDRSPWVILVELVSRRDQFVKIRQPIVAVITRISAR